MKSEEEIGIAIAATCTTLLASNAPPELVVNSLLALAIRLGVEIAGPVHFARQLMTDAEKLLARAQLERGVEKH